MKRVIVPFFIPHQGCPHQCVFCDQRAISGKSAPLAESEIVETIGRWRAFSASRSVEVAFYGGTFTALPIYLQERLLAPLQPMLRSGEVSSLRVSTRPDALDRERVSFLRDRGVELVELGVQSMDDAVLRLAGRGHLAAHCEEAFDLLKCAGMKVGVQLMPGLPGDTAAGAINSLRRLLPLCPDLLRIYPAIVLKGTELATLYADGRYSPLTMDGAVSICKVMLHDAAVAGVRVIRVGLHHSEEFASGGEVIAGPYHPAFRQLADGERWHDLLALVCADFAVGDELEVSVSPARVSDLVGQKRFNLRRIEDRFRVRFRRVCGEASLGFDEIVISSGSMTVMDNILKRLRYDVSMNVSKEKP